MKGSLRQRTDEHYHALGLALTAIVLASALAFAVLSVRLAGRHPAYTQPS